MTAKIEIDEEKMEANITIPIQKPKLSSTGKMYLIISHNWADKIEGTYKGEKLKGNIIVGYKNTDKS